MAPYTTSADAGASADTDYDFDTRLTALSALADAESDPAVDSKGEKLDRCVASVREENPDMTESDAYAVCNAQLNGEAAADGDSGSGATATPTESKAEFSEGDAVMWRWQGSPVHGRVADIREQATVSGNTITGEDGERDVYVIDEWDERVGAFRKENVAKPEEGLNESQKDLPDRSEDNYVDSEAWDSLTTVVSESRFTARELDYLSQQAAGLGVLYNDRPNEWLVPEEDPVVFRYEIPDEMVEGTDLTREDFVPNAGVADAAEKTLGWDDEYGDEVAGGAEDGEGTRRANQLVEHHDRGEPLAPEYWREIRAFHERKHAQDSHLLSEEHAGEPHRDAGYVGHLRWGGDAGFEQARRIVEALDAMESEAHTAGDTSADSDAHTDADADAVDGAAEDPLTLHGAVTTDQRVDPATITEADSNRVDLDALDGELREAVEAEDFYIYGKASIEQWDDDDPPTFIQMDALEGALDRFFGSTNAPGIISRHHQDIPVGRPVREFTFSADRELEIGGETYHFEEGDVARSHVADADGDGRPELWLAANLANDNEMSKKTRVLAAQGDLNGFSVTVHRNEDDMTQEGRVVTDCDLHAVTIGTDQQIKNAGSEFDVADFKSVVGAVKRRAMEVIRG